MPWELARDWLLFTTTVLGGGLALAPAQKHFSGLEAWCVGIAWALAILSGPVLLAHWFGLPLGWYALGYAALALAAVRNRRRAAELLREETVRDALAGWVLVTGGALALLGCIFSYSGGAWIGDWEEQFHRPLLFLRLRAEGEFHPLFAFTSRPPLANAADAALLWVTGADFARHQVQMLLLNALAFLPVALWARTLGGGRAAAMAASLLVLLNPLFLQNSTYAWTKLICAYFVLAGMHLLVVQGGQRHRAVAGFSLLMLGVLTHYSACVWLLTLGGGWLWAQRARWAEREFRVTAALAATAAGALFAPWFLFAVTRYGLGSTLTSNSSFEGAAEFTWWENLLSTGPKLWHSLVPHPLRDFDRSMFDQLNPWTRFRDLAFMAYQCNLFLGAGAVSLLLLGCGVLKPAWRPSQRPAGVWIVTGLATIVLGTAVHGYVDLWGLAHICLQPMILLGVAFAASRLPLLLRGGHPGLAAAAAGLALADYLLGIVMHYAGTAMQLNRAPGQDLFAYANSLSTMAKLNLSRKIFYGQDFLMDTLSQPWWSLLVVFTALVVLAGMRTRRLARQETAPDSLHRTAGAVMNSATP